MKLEVIDEDAAWDELRAGLGLEGPYVRLDWARIWAVEEGGRAFGIVGRGSAGTVLYPLVEIPLDRLAGGAGHVDWRTPYDFGGPFVAGPDPADVLARFEPALRAWGRARGVVTEFARLHPYRTALARPSDALPHQDHCVAVLDDGLEAARAACDSTHRRNVRAARRRGVGVAVHEDPNPAVAEAFIELYAETMEHLGASADYRFSRATMEAILARGESVLVTAAVDDRIIAAHCYLVSGDTLFYFLGASSRADLSLRPVNLLHDAAFELALARGLRRLHLGGGADPLRRFKRQIGPSSQPYFVLRRVHDEPAYRRLVDRNPTPAPATFPAYRRVLRGGA